MNQESVLITLRSLRQFLEANVDDAAEYSDRNSRLYESLTESKSILFDFEPRDGKERYREILNTIYAVRQEYSENLSLIKLFIASNKFRLVIFYLNAISIFIIYVFLGNSLLMLVSIIAISSLYIPHVVISRSLVQDKLNSQRQIGEELDELILLLNDYSAWLEWSEKRTTVLEMRKEYEQKKAQQ